MGFLSDLGPVGGAAVGVGLAFATGGASVPFTTLALGGLAGASIGAQAQGAELAGEQAEEAKTQANIKNAVAGLAGQRNRSEMLRRARIARGQVEAQGSVTGTQRSSSVVGGVSGLESTTASNVGFSQATADAGQKLFQSGQKIFDLEKKKGRADLIAGVSTTLFNIGIEGKRGNLG